jgi:hypothetical protein
MWFSSMAKAFSKFLIMFLSVIGFSGSVAASTYDNQWFPYGSQILFRKVNNYSKNNPSFWVTVADKSRSSQGGSMGTFELFGAYDLNAVAKSLVATGKPNPLRSQWQGNAIPFRQRGTIQMVAASVGQHQACGEWCAIGGSIFFASLKVRPEMLLLRDQVDARVFGPGDYDEIDRDQRLAAQELGLNQFASHELGWGDLDLYTRVGHIWEYPYKFRSIDAGAWFGAIFPTGKRRELNNPYSLPYAGNGFWGVYGAVDMEFEFKEDMTVGFLLRGQKRFTRTFDMRVPAGTEPINYGAIVGQFETDPGASIIFVVSGVMDDIREGLGLSISYQLVKKYADKYTDRRVDQTVPANLVGITNLSSWLDEHLTVKMFYDFSKHTDASHHAPTMYLRWDFPVKGLGARRVAETNRIVFGLDVPY